MRGDPVPAPAPCPVLAGHDHQLCSLKPEDCARPQPLHFRALSVAAALPPFGAHVLHAQLPCGACVHHRRRRRHYRPDDAHPPYSIGATKRILSRFRFALVCFTRKARALPLPISILTLTPSNASGTPPTVPVQRIKRRVNFDLRFQTLRELLLSVCCCLRLHVQHRYR